MKVSEADAIRSGIESAARQIKSPYERTAEEGSCAALQSIALSLVLIAQILLDGKDIE